VFKLLHCGVDLNSQHDSTSFRLSYVYIMTLQRRPQAVSTTVLHLQSSFGTCKQSLPQHDHREAALDVHLEVCLHTWVLAYDADHMPTDYAYVQHLETSTPI